MTTLKKSTCPHCSEDNYTESISRPIQCATCSKRYSESPLILRERLGFIDARIQDLHAERMRLTGERDDLLKALAYVMPIPEVVWKRLEFPMACHKCGKPTRWASRGAATCFDGKCKTREASGKTSRTRTKVGWEDLPEDLIAQILGSDDEPDDFEVVKGGSR